MESEYESDYSVQNLYKQEFELLKDMFEAHFSPDVIAGVLEDCDGDVNLAVDTLTKIESGTGQENSDLTGTPTETEISPSIDTECPSSNMSTNANTSLSSQSYAAASQTPINAAGAYISANTIRPRSKNVMPKIDYWTDQMRKIITDYNEGSRLLVIMRGPPGCGKTYMARVIVESTVGITKTSNYTNHIFSADDHMQVNGRYHYDVRRLEDTHIKNQKRVFKAVHEGRSPVIVDNTNMAAWEMYPYVKDAVMNGYIIEIFEPKTSWSCNASKLAKRNSHGVPMEKIERMLQKYDGAHDGASLLKYWNLQYPEGKKPPVRRNIPPFINLTPLNLNPFVNTEQEAYLDRAPSNSDSASTRSRIRSTGNESPNNVDNPISSVNMSSNVETSHTTKQQETAKNLDEMLKVEVEWDNGAEWEATSSTREPENSTTTVSDPKPQRSKVNTMAADTFIDSSILHDDWSKYFMYVPPWQGDTASNVEDEKITEMPVTTISTSTNIERGDFYSKNFNTKFGVPRNINEIPNPNKKEVKIPKQRMLDQSTITHTAFSTGRCEHEEKHFVSMKKMFKNISRPVLREIFDNCAGDVYWASSIVLDGIQKNNFRTVTIEEADSDEEDEVECECLARYNVIPDKATESVLPQLEEKLPPDSPTTLTAITLSKKKTKKDRVLTEDTFILKRQIEKSIMIADNHYSQHYLNLRRAPRHDKSPNNDGEPSASHSNGNAMDINEANASLNPELSNQNKSTNDDVTNITQDAVLNPYTLDQNIHRNERTVNTVNIKQDENPNVEISIQKTSSSSPGTSSMRAGIPEFPQNAYYRDIPSTSFCTSKYSEPIVNITDDDYESDDNISVTCESPNVTVNLGMEFIRKLDEIYGRPNFDYPEGVMPILSIPTDVMLQLNALWIESISDQLDKNIPKQMIRQDEEFARKLQCQLELEANRDYADDAIEASETIKQNEPESTSFKEIMDVDLALAIYEKQVKHIWKSKEPQDMAAQMTRKKLFELFPDVNKDVLSELLIAHDNKFEATVEILLISTGQGHYLDQSNPINKFVEEKTKENKAKLLIAEGKAIHEENECSKLMDSGSNQEAVSMDIVNEWRLRAEKFRIARDLYRNKAIAHYNSGDYNAATQFNAIASLHTSNYDSSNHYAAAALVHYHANAHPDTHVIDLHFLRVAEAEISLDLFIDDRLRNLRQSATHKSITLHIITGRGKHSPGRPRIRPAVMKRLTARGLTFRQQNPGLLEARLKHTHRLTDEL